MKGERRVGEGRERGGWVKGGREGEKGREVERFACHCIYEVVPVGGIVFIYVVWCV